MIKVCPRCKASQKFPNRKRIIGDICEVFIKCTICRWELVVMRDNVAKIHDIEEIKKLKIRAKKSPELNNVIRKKLEKYE